MNLVCELFECIDLTNTSYLRPMQPFLQKIVQHLQEKHPDELGELCIVLPNRRAGLFLKTHMSSTLNKTFWAPDVYAIEDFVTLLSGLQLADTTTLLFELYETHKKITGSAAESFDDFSRWGQVLLADLNDIDRYLVDVDQLFGNLKDIKELETWTLNQEEELTDFQKQYVQFWKSLGKYYTDFKFRLLHKRLAYQGLIYRVAADNIAEKTKNHSWKKIIFAGFNALNKAEENIIEYLLNTGNAEIIWDVDSYYVNNIKQEAGTFFRKHNNSAKFSKAPNTESRNYVIQENFLATEAKHIHIIGATKNVAQAKLAGSIIQKIQHTQANLQNTALVLADENLLFPVLHALPDSLSDVNVTMGYPLKSTPMSGYFDLLFNMHISAIKLSSGSKIYSYYYRDLLNFLNHPYSNTLVFDADKNQSLKPAIQKIQKQNILFTSLNSLERIMQPQGEDLFRQIKPLFINWKTPADAIHCFVYLINELKNAIVKQQAADLKQTESLELEYLYAYTKIFKRVEALMIDYPDSITDIKTLYALVKQIVQTSTLAFYGEPLMGLQVMGMLETRTLDFENVILLSCNENILPSGKTGNSFIPFELKRYFGLPTYQDKDAIFAYHFYRLLQRAKNIYLLYNTENDALGMGEKSRFLTQLTHELPLINKKLIIQQDLFSIPVEVKSPNNRIVITKTEDVMTRLKEKALSGFSPSLLNIYIKCPLQFYFHAVVGLKEHEEVEETAGAAVFGKVIHGVLETLYAPYSEKIVSAEGVHKMNNQVEDLVLKEFEKQYAQGELSLGKNLLTVRMAIRFIHRFLETEKHFIQQQQKQNCFLTINKLEEKLETTVALGDYTIGFKGTVDRIDALGGQVRIIDYKTGKADNNELKVNAWEGLTTDTNLAKSFQLLMYAWLYHKNHPLQKTNLTAGIVSFKHVSAGLKTIKLNGSPLITAEILQEFEYLLLGIVTEVFDTTKHFYQTEKKENCQYCSFTGICGRVDV